MNPSDKPSSEQQHDGNNESPERETENVSPNRVVQTENVSPNRVQTENDSPNRVQTGAGRSVRPQGASGGGGDGQGSSRKKRGRSEDRGASGSGGSKPRKKGDLDVPENVEPSCSLCGKRFGSWKAVFGHLRAHPRDWKGAYPPPAFKPEGSPERQPVLREQLAPTLLHLAKETLATLGEEGFASVTPQGPRPSSSVADGAGDSSSPSSRRVRLNIDLNETQEEMGGSSPKSCDFDLNMPPSEKDDGNGTT